jgi:hypothetical protein
MYAAYIDFNPDTEVILNAGCTALEGRDEVVGFEVFAASEGYTEQVGKRKGTPWRNPTTGAIRIGLYWSDNFDYANLCGSVLRMAIGAIKGVKTVLAIMAEDADRRERGLGVRRRNPNDIILTPPK